MLWGAHWWDFNLLQQGTETWSPTQWGRGGGGGGGRSFLPAWERSLRGRSLARLLWQPSLYLRIYFCIFPLGLPCFGSEPPQSNDLLCPVFLPQPWPAPRVCGGQAAGAGSAFQRLPTGHLGESLPLSGHPFLGSKIKTRAMPLCLGLRSKFQAPLWLEHGADPSASLKGSFCLHKAVHSVSGPSRKLSQEQAPDRPRASCPDNSMSG